MISTILSLGFSLQTICLTPQLLLSYHIQYDYQQTTLFWCFNLNGDKVQISWWGGGEVDGSEQDHSFRVLPTTHFAHIAVTAYRQFSPL